jgi:hypothetical protein
MVPAVLQQRCPVRVAVGECQLGIPGQTQGHKRGAAGRQAPVQRLIQQRPVLIEPAPQDSQFNEGQWSDQQAFTRPADDW